MKTGINETMYSCSKTRSKTFLIFHVMNFIQVSLQPETGEEKRLSSAVNHSDEVAPLSSLYYT